MKLYQAIRTRLSDTKLVMTIQDAVTSLILGNYLVLVIVDDRESTLILAANAILSIPYLAYSRYFIAKRLRDLADRLVANER